MDFLATALSDGALHSPLGALSLLFALVIGHALCDFPLQGQFLAAGKNRNTKMPDPEGDPFPGNLWAYCLTAHALIHAGMVWVITGSPLFALIELVCHWLIDFGKCEKWTNFAGDQALHILCKIGFALAVYFGVGA